MDECLEQLLAAAKGANNWLILTHNNPDPDAIASAVALAYLLAEKLKLPAKLAYRGIIGRAENQALVQYLGHPLQRFSPSLLQEADGRALVDTQPGAGNNALPAGITPAIVIDHHPRLEATARVRYADVRPDVGAASSLMVQYLRAAGLSPPASLATALFYGIKTDTMGLKRATSQLDMDATCYLLSRIDLEGLMQIEHAQVPISYFQGLTAALQATRIYGSVVITYLGLMSYPDLTAEIADLLLRLRGCEWAICMGTHKDRFIISVRTQKQRGAGVLAQMMVGDLGFAGGHGAMAGGQIILTGQDPEKLARDLTHKAKEHLNISARTRGKSLMLG